MTKSIRRRMAVPRGASEGSKSRSDSAIARVMLYRSPWFQLLVCLWALPCDARAQAAHEIALIVNRNSPVSRQVANHYIEARGVPVINVIHLDTVPAGRSAISPKEFTEWVWEPVRAELDRRGLGERVFAWVYSADFPYRVTHKPQVSFTGIHLANNELPEDPEQIKKGLWRSKYFAGPDAPGGPVGDSLSLVRFASFMSATNRPPVAMALTYTGQRGLSAEESLALIERSVAADHAQLAAPVLIYSNRNVRSTCRGWEFAPAAAELRARSRAVEIRPGAQPSGRAGGVMTGTANLKLDDLKLVPGALGEHLTSFGAAFDTGAQTKCVEWLRAGAAATCGTVVEPYAIWTKFPHARVFAHQAAGCTALESLVLSVRSPLQSYFVGDPLSAPCMRRITLKPETELTDEFLVVRPGIDDAGLPWAVLINGRLASGRLVGPRVHLRRAMLPPGASELRIIAFNDERVRHHGVAVVNLNLPGPAVRVRRDGPGVFVLEAEGEPESLNLVRGLDVLGAGARVEVDPGRVGPGPVRVQAEAVYKDGIRVRSEPLRWLIE